MYVMVLFFTYKVMYVIGVSGFQAEDTSLAAIRTSHKQSTSHWRTYDIKNSTISLSQLPTGMLYIMLNMYIHVKMHY